MTIQHTEEGRMLEKALEGYPALAHRLDEADRVLIVKGAFALRDALKSSMSWALYLVCDTLASHPKPDGPVASRYVEKAIRPRLSSEAGVGETGALPLPRGVE